MGNVTLQKATGNEFRGSLVTWPESRVTREIQSIKDSSNSSMYFSRLFRGSTIASQSQGKLRKSLLHRFFTKLSHIAFT